MNHKHPTNFHNSHSWLFLSNKYCLEYYNDLLQFFFYYKLFKTKIMYYLDSNYKIYPWNEYPKW